jgi:Co/Zn/Cd efflux system component
MLSAQIGVYILFDSLSVLADAFHNLSDVAAVAIALVAHRVKRRRPTEVRRCPRW